MSVISGNLADGKPMQYGGYYNGQAWDGTKLLAPGLDFRGNSISNEVIAQTNPANVAYIAQQKQNYAQSNPTPALAFTPTPQAPTTTASATPTATGGQAPSVFAPAPLDLNATYQNLVSSSGITAKDAEIAQKRQQASEAKAKINDNPFLSEATRVGRIAKIDQLANDTLGNLQNEVATKRADIQMQLELQTKQFDINSQQAQQNLSQFNSLLTMGALDNASPEDIANITRSTGLSSGIIANAINAKKIAGYDTATESFDDGTNEGFIIYTIDQMGNVISQSKQVTGKSTPKAQAFDTSAFLQGLGNTGASKGSIDDLW